jgi:restriction endonuclease Mrr
VFRLVCTYFNFAITHKLIPKVPGFQDFMLPLVQMAADGKEHTGKQPIVNNRIGWARTYLTKAGLLETTGRALFRITPRGQSVLKEKYEKIDLSVLDRFPEFAKFRTSTPKPQILKVAPPKGNEFDVVVRGGKATMIFEVKYLPRIFEALGI